MSGLYFSKECLSQAFEQLRLRVQKSKKGKKGLEQTNAVATFLAVDATQKLLKTPILLLSPGHDNRNKLTEQYVSMFKLWEDDNWEVGVHELGYAKRVKKGTKEERTLAKRLSSDVLTQSLKRASEAANPRDYPRRPPFPLLKFGVEVEGSRWGVTKHPHWKQNFLKFFEGRECGEDLFPLIVFLLREENLNKFRSLSFLDGIREALKERFTDELAEYLVEHSRTESYSWDRAELFSSEKIEAKDVFVSVESEEESGTSSGLVQVGVTWPKIDELKIEIECPKEVLASALAALKSGSHVIFTGPPGTGKTTLAIEIARHCKGDAFYVHTATSDWTAFEVLGGYMPDPRFPQRLNFSPGIVVKAIKDNAWLIVDEINRADVDKAFGELFTLLAGKDVVLTHRVYEFDEEGRPIGDSRQIVLRVEKENSTTTLSG